MEFANSWLTDNAQCCVTAARSWFDKFYKFTHVASAQFLSNYLRLQRPAD
jgi:hypothetical protein